MKKILLLSLLFIQPVYAYYTETIPNQCGVIGNNLYAVFEINTYTCESGYFLPADTLGCVQCPNGYMCNGGTFSYNAKISQGITYKTQFNENVSNACSSNFGHNLFAVFEPNTITINWDDGTNTTQNTCTYGQSITLPPTPVRPGYKFGGWRIKNQN